MASGDIVLELNNVVPTAFNARKDPATFNVTLYTSEFLLGTAIIEGQTLDVVLGSVTLRDSSVPRVSFDSPMVANKTYKVTITEV